GVFFVDSGGDFQTMEESLALYGETGVAAKAEGRYAEPELVSVSQTQPLAVERIRRIVGALMSGLGLRDVFSADFRVEPDHRVHTVALEGGRGLPGFDFRACCRREWGLGLAAAMAETAAARLGETCRPPGSL